MGINGDKRILGIFHQSLLISVNPHYNGECLVQTITQNTDMYKSNLKLYFLINVVATHHRPVYFIALVRKLESDTSETISYEISYVISYEILSEVSLSSFRTLALN